MGMRYVSTRPQNLRQKSEVDQTAARIGRIEKAEKPDSYTVHLEGLARIRLPRSLPPVLSILPPNPLPISTYSVPLPVQPASSNHDLLPLAFRLLPAQLHDRLKMVPPSLLADLLVTVLRVDWETKAEILGLPDVDERTAKVKQVLQGLNPGVAPTGNNQERSVIARPNARKPTKQTPNPPISPGSGQSEDLQPLHRLLSERQEELSNAAKQAVTRELGRLTNVPPQSAEYSLVRTYVELLLNLPWKKVSEVDDNLDLEEARRRLEAEHEGLEAVKRRVVEYLAVYR